MASNNQLEDSVPEPFPIFTLAHKYMLYDVNVVSYVRAKYNVIGVLMGGLPQAPQQNVFLGIPLELMPEEARLLVEKGVAYIVDDVKAHKQGFSNGLDVEERRAFQSALRRQGVAAAKDAERRGEERKNNALHKKFGTSDWNDIPEEMLVPSAKRAAKKGKKPGNRPPVSDGSDISRAPSGAATPAEEDDSLFASPMNSFPASGPPKPTSRSQSLASAAEPQPYAVTPTTSMPPLTSAPPPNHEALPLPEVPPSYPLFKHLHEKQYFMAPGLRFGCQYMAYPGDPLRFHSHFLCNGMDWDQEFDLLDLVGGGRLGTGVKKGYLIGGQETSATHNEVKGEDNQSEGNVRTFCVEWGGM
jgi:tRNA-splicing endonuclease subunit Sen34